MAHTSTPVAVGVHSIGTCCIRPSDAGQVGSGQVGSGQVGAVHIGAEHVGSDQVGALQIGAVPVGADEVTSRKVNPGVRGDRTVVGDTVGALFTIFTVQAVRAGRTLWPDRVPRDDGRTGLAIGSGDTDIGQLPRFEAREVAGTSSACSGSNCCSDARGESGSEDRGTNEHDKRPGGSHRVSSLERDSLLAHWRSLDSFQFPAIATTELVGTRRASVASD
jgi:hypothetical protein